MKFHPHKPLWSLEFRLSIVFFLISLASFIFVLLRPVSYTQTAKNVQAWDQVSGLGAALIRYQNAHSGVFPGKFMGVETPICRQQTHCEGVSLDVLVPEFIPAIPVDMRSKDPGFSGFSLVTNDDGGVRVRAMYTDIPLEIAVFP